MVRPRVSGMWRSDKERALQSRAWLSSEWRRSGMSRCRCLRQVWVAWPEGRIVYRRECQQQVSLLCRE